jgi:hypothetical protein
LSGFHWATAGPAQSAAAANNTPAVMPENVDLHLTIVSSHDEMFRDGLLLMRAADHLCDAIEYESSPGWRDLSRK